MTWPLTTGIVILAAGTAVILTTVSRAVIRDAERRAAELRRAAWHQTALRDLELWEAEFGGMPHPRMPLRQPWPGDQP